MALTPCPAAAAPRLELKRGDTLALDCQALEAEAGPARDLTGWSLRAQVRNHAGALLAELAVTVTDATEGHYSLVAPAATTATWAPGQAAMDIEYTDPEGVVQSSETVVIHLLADETR